MSEDILTLKPPPADARLSYGPDPNQFLDLRLPTKPENRHPSPLVINLHGGFWRARYGLEHAGHLCAALAARGLASANLEYRRVGNEGGGWPGTFGDIRSAYSFLVQNSSQHNLDAHRIAVLGHSAGGQLALCLAAHEPAITRVVSLAGVVNLEQAFRLHLSNDAVVEFLGGRPSDVAEHYAEADPMRLSIARARQWLVHGSADDVIPPAFSRDYVRAKQMRNEDVHLLEIRGAGHYDVIDPRTEAWKAIEKILLDLLS